MLRSSLLVRCLGMMGIGALACLPACSGKVSESAGGGGSGGEGGEGGAGGEVTTTSGSEGGGTPTTSGGCSPACDEHSACVDGECAPVRIASLQALHQRMYGQGGVFGEFAQVSACERPSGSPYVNFEIVAEEGSCRAMVYEPTGEEDGPIGLSEAVAKAPSFGTLTLGGDMGDGCLSAAVPVTPAYLDGETVSFEVAAGAHNAAFEIALESPAALALTAGTIMKGQPYEITWETGGPPPFLAVLPSNDSVQIECTPTEGTSLVIPASLTALLAPGESGVIVVGLRPGPESTVEISPTYRARASGLRVELHEVTLIQNP